MSHHPNWLLLFFKDFWKIAPSLSAQKVQVSKSVHRSSVQNWLFFMVDGCGAYFLPSSNAAAIHESLDVNKLPNKTSSSSSLSSFRSTHDNHHSAFNPQQQQLQYVKPLPTCEHEAETLRALMIVLCIENCLACAIATLSTIISLLLIAKNKVRLFPVA